MSKKPVPTDSLPDTDIDTASGNGGKVENDHNKMGDKEPTQLNEGRRTPDSRHDREAHIGGSNQTQSRKGAGGSSTH